MATTINADTAVGGAIVTGDASGVLALQAAGSTQVTVNGSGVVLANPLPIGSGGTGATSLSGITTGTATNIAGGSNGTIPYQSASGTTQMLAVGTSGQVLQTNGVAAPTWVSQSTLSVGTATNATNATNATTATNLASGSAGTIPYQSAAGTTAMLAAGTSGQVLQSNGASAPTWITPAAGGSWQHISTITASAASTVDVENAMTAYKMYVIIYTGLICSSAGQDFQCLLKISGSYATTGYESIMIRSGGSATYQATLAGTTSILVSDDMSSNAASETSSSIIYLPNPSQSTKKVLYSLGNSTYRRQANCFGGNAIVGTLTGVRFFASAGTITGTFSLYGISNT
jgi:hypothetical protein